MEAGCSISREAFARPNMLMFTHSLSREKAARENIERGVQWEDDAEDP